LQTSSDLGFSQIYFAAEILWTRSTEPWTTPGFGPRWTGPGRQHWACRSFGLRPLRCPWAPAKGRERRSGTRGVWWVAHRGEGSSVAAGHRGDAVVVGGGARWGGVPARERRREEVGEGWDAPGVLGGFYRGRCGVAGVMVALMALTPLKTVVRFKGWGSDGGAVMARAASQSAEQAAWWNSVATRLGSAGAGWKTELIDGARLIERRERSDQLGRCEPKGKTYFRKDATDAQAGWADEDSFSLPGGGGGEGPAGPAGAKAEWAGKVSRAESEEEGFLN
jgi:hypothetical protein